MCRYYLGTVMKIIKKFFAIDNMFMILSAALLTNMVLSEDYFLRWCGCLILIYGGLLMYNHVHGLVKEENRK